ncbi:MULTISPECIES: translation elongation factor Ts [Methylosinus]|uniref:Elongation factor Ts n=1 Tax=Methylosinus trichosporium (strain ATCC 35070 / NCIMB 11131 / UNIQEM 75 / OB3b) TaxID=595536 RepID=A0A2D2D2E1_METT3|nr:MULTISPECIES: translation elongation factor Ts [Methylosinus]ATQ69155.1 elongation factor Ts [Methylosinus trichosporium OB3b]OBS53579.1 translation elongation factor Ts [Methylosinus sp. 3S-1]
MATITAALVKDLRESTGAGMMDCKAALTETDGDIEAAVDWLRKKGLSKAAKKSGRVAAEGLVAAIVGEGVGVVVEVNSETDFVARNEDFQKLVRTIADVALSSGAASAEELTGKAYPGGGTVAEAITSGIATIGENLTLRRAGGFAVEGAVSRYVHTQISDGLGKIAVIVALESKGDKEVLSTLARQIAMHVASANPLALDASGLDPATIEREKALLAEKNAGKPAHVLEKIIESGLKTYYKEVVLLDQVSNHPDHSGKTIAQTLKEHEGKAGSPIAIKGFLRYALGEGIEKETSDFAAEVAAAAKG